MILEITAEGWVIIIGSIAAAATTIGAAVVGVIMALAQLNRKVGAAAERREQIAGAVLNPETTVNAAPPVSPPKE